MSVSPGRGASALTGVWSASLPALLAAWLAACAPVVQPLPAEPQPAPPMPGGPGGGPPGAPDLVLDVVNRSSSQVTIGHAFSGPSMSGEGITTVAACERSVAPVGDVQGDYEILVDDAAIGEGAVPAALPVEAVLIVPVEIDPDGVATMGRVRISGTQPRLLTQHIGCDPDR